MADLMSKMVSSTWVHVILRIKNIQCMSVVGGRVCAQWTGAPSPKWMQFLSERQVSARSVRRISSHWRSLLCCTCMLDAQIYIHSSKQPQNSASITRGTDTRRKRFQLLSATHLRLFLKETSVKISERFSKREWIIFVESAHFELQKWNAYALSSTN